MKIGTFATFMSPLATPKMIGDFGRRAEAAGLDLRRAQDATTIAAIDTFDGPVEAAAPPMSTPIWCGWMSLLPDVRPSNGRRRWPGTASRWHPPIRVRCAL